MAKWQLFDTTYPGYDTYREPRQRSRVAAPRTRRDLPRGNKTYQLVITPLNSNLTLRVGDRRLSYHAGLRFVRWLRQRGHTAFLY